MAVRVILPTFGKSRKTRKPNGRARHFANFRKIEENDKVRSVYGGSVGETRISL